MRPFSQHLRPQNRVFASEWVTGAHLINAIEQENITIEGQGTIDGQGRFWMNESNTYPAGPNGDYDFTPNENRPAQMIFLCECKNIHISGVSIVNVPYWHLFLHGCTNAVLHGLKISGTPLTIENADGVTVDNIRAM